MKKCRQILVIIAFAMFGLSFAGAQEAKSPDELREILQLFGAQTGDSAKEVDQLVADLESASFAERANALKKLAMRPILPGHVLELADSHPNLEVRYQIKKLRDDEARAQRAAKLLRETMSEIASGEVGGLAKDVLGVLPSADQSNILPQAGAALLATAGEGDRDLILKAMADEKLDDGAKKFLIPVLGKLGGEGVDEVLIEAMKSANPFFKESAAMALARNGNKASLPVLGELLAAENLIVRLRAVSALRDLTGQNFGYRAGTSPEERAPAAEKWLKWIEKNGEGIDLGELGKVMAGVDLSSGFGPWLALDGGGGEGEPEKLGWSCEGGILKILGDRGDGSSLRTEARFKDYVLKLEWQNVPGSFGDSGIGVGGQPEGGDAESYLEVQVLPNMTGDFYSIGRYTATIEGRPLSFSSKKKKPSNEKPAGEWNQMEIRVADGKVEVRVNGELQNSAEGLPKEDGNIVIRNEGHEVWFRNMVVVPIE